MAFGTGTIRDFGGAVSDLFASSATAQGLRLKAQGDIAEGENYSLAANLAKQNATYEEMSTKVKETQAQRAEYLGIGTERADIAGSGFSMSGSALDLLRSGAQQGALQKQIVSEQGQITEAGYNEQATAYTNLANYANFAASQEESMAGKAQQAGYISAGIKALSGAASLFV